MARSRGQRPHTASRSRPAEPDPRGSTHHIARRMELEENLGQITAAVGRVCLRFKNAPEAPPPPQGQIFAKCTFVGRGASFFVPTPPAADGDAPAAAAVDNAAGSLLLPSPSVQSEPVDFVNGAIGSSRAEEEGSAAAGVDVVTSDHGDDPNKSVAAAAADVDAGVVVVDVGFSLDTVKFGLDEPDLSMLDTTEIKIDMCLCGDTETIIGTASVRVSSILSGKNEWTEELALGTYTAKDTEAAGGADEPDVKPTADAVDNDDDGAATTTATVQDVSPGPLEFGGATSTVRVTLLTNDDTADYTLGAGSLWTDGAEIVGVPEGWKVVPPPETEHSAWNEAIAQTLAGVITTYSVLYDTTAVCAFCDMACSLFSVFTASQGKSPAIYRSAAGGHSTRLLFAAVMSVHCGDRLPM